MDELRTPNDVIAQPDFSTPVPPGGYHWWYVDASSDCGQHHLVIIAFVGSVFSPYYKLKGRKDPENHVAINCVYYGPDEHRWSLTERGEKQLTRTQTSFVVGPSSLSINNGVLTVSMDEVTAPFPSDFSRPLPKRIRGELKLKLGEMNRTPFAIDANGKHGWWPMAPKAPVTLKMEAPDIEWSGHGYFDTNWGSEPLEDGFDLWDWSRSITDDGAILLYDADWPGGDNTTLALAFNERGQFEQLTPPPRHDIVDGTRIVPPNQWAVPRRPLCDLDAQPRLIKRLEDTPFYTRAIIETTLYGRRVTSMHESLSGTRFRKNWVHALLPFRMPRKRW